MAWSGGDATSVVVQVGQSIAYCGPYSAREKDPWPNDWDCGVYTWSAGDAAASGQPGPDYVVTGASLSSGVAAMFVAPGGTELPAFVPIADEPASSGQVVTFGEPFNLSPADGAIVGAAIVSLWALAFALRALVRVLGSDNSGSNED